MKILLPLFILLALHAHAQKPDNLTYRDLKAGHWKADTSPIYSLPWAKGKKVLLIQAYDSKMSHRNEVALDFKMKKGTQICAARNGIVTSLREDSDKGGLKDENLSDGNYIIIKHNDGTEAHYWHLQKDGVLANIGDTVKTGQLIGLSGNTGYTAFPHLHFEVVNSKGSQIPTRFYTRKGIKYLRPVNWYKRVE
jgi:hypothetical protein